jgi:hypothetical protein
LEKKKSQAEDQHGESQTAWGIRQFQIHFHRLEHDGEDLPVHMVDDIKEGADDQDIMRPPAACL